MSSVQSQIQQDWNNREFVETIASSVKRIAEFLNAFDLSARSRLEECVCVENCLDSMCMLLCMCVHVPLALPSVWMVYSLVL